MNLLFQLLILFSHVSYLILVNLAVHYRLVSGVGGGNHSILRVVKESALSGVELA